MFGQWLLSRSSPTNPVVELNRIARWGCRGGFVPECAGFLPTAFIGQRDPERWRGGYRRSQLWRLTEGHRQRHVRTAVDCATQCSVPAVSCGRAEQPAGP